MQIFDIPSTASGWKLPGSGRSISHWPFTKNDLKKNVLGFVNWHWHYEFQLTYVVRGTISVFFNQQTIDLHEGRASTSIRRCST